MSRPGEPQRRPASWTTAPPRQGPGRLLADTVSDLYDLTAGWRRTRDGVTPRGAGPSQSGRGSAGTEPARTPAERLLRARRLPARLLKARVLPARLVRRAVHTAAVRPLLRTQLHLDVGGLEEFDGLTGPLVIVANHASHLDTPLILDALPSAERRRTGVAVTADYWFESGWRAGASAIAFNTFAHTVPGPGPSRAGDLLDAGSNVLVFGQGGRSADGYVGEFTPHAAALAIEHGVRVLPVGIRGSYAAMPRGQAWPGNRDRSGLFGRDRPRVSVRFGPALSPRPEETVEELTGRVAAAVRQLIAEDVTTWWQSQRDPQAGSAEQPPAGSWRRTWEQSQPPQPGGTVRRSRIWH